MKKIIFGFIISLFSSILSIWISIYLWDGSVSNSDPKFLSLLLLFVFIGTVLGGEYIGDGVIEILKNNGRN